MKKNVLLFLCCLLAHLSCHSVQESSTAFSGEGYAVLCSSGMGLRDVEDLPAPKSWRGIGTSELTITTSSDSAQHWFNQGLNHLHGFSHLEAWRAFREVVRLDPDCAMGYWGIGMCMPGFVGDDAAYWNTAIEQANRLAKKATPLERGLITAMALTAREGLEGAKTAWQALVSDFPKEPEALAFGAIMLRQLVSSQQESDAIKSLLERALAQFPEHVGLNHYYVHALEVRPDYALAQGAADKLPQLAPAAAHLLHMPGHLDFIRGDYAKAATAFEAARAVEENYHYREELPFAFNQNYLHNLHYLAVTYSELGDQVRALEAAETYAKVSLDRVDPKGGIALVQLFEGRSLPALVNIRFGDYDAAIRQLTFWLSVAGSPVEEPMVRNYLEALRLYCQGMEAILAGDVGRARGCNERLSQQINAYRLAGEQLVSAYTGELAGQAFHRLLIRQYELNGWLENTQVDQPFRAVAWEQAEMFEAQFPYDEPPRLMYPVAESLARLHLRRGEISRAREALNRALQIRPNSPRISGLLATL